MKTLAIIGAIVVTCVSCTPKCQTCTKTNLGPGSVSETQEVCGDEEALALENLSVSSSNESWDCQ